MNKYLYSVLVLIIGISALAIGFGSVKGERRYSWRYRMTVEIETPEGIKTGSAVREVTVIFYPNSSVKSGYNNDVDMKGEAVVVDLEENRTIFAIQGVEDHARPFYLFDGPPGRTIKGAEFYSKLRGKADIDPKDYPKIVAFRDMSDPLSVRLVYGNKENDPYEDSPYSFQDNFEKIYGPGYKLKRVMIEMTDEPVTYKIEKMLPWIMSYKNKLLDGGHTLTIDAKNRLANSLGMGSFTTGKEKQK